MQKKIKDLIVLIPAYNESGSIKKIITQTQKIADVIVVDDFSKDSTSLLSKRYSNYYIRNNKNFGYDISIFKGLNFIIKNLKKYEYIITFDGDGQHNSRYIRLLYNDIKNKKYECIIGKRNKFNRVSEKMCGFFSKILFNISDPFSGMKCYKIKSLNKNIRKIDQHKKYGGIFSLYIFKNFKETDIKVNSSKHSRFGGGLITELILIKYFLKLVVFKIFIKV